MNQSCFIKEIQQPNLLRVDKIVCDDKEINSLGLMACL